MSDEAQPVVVDTNILFSLLLKKDSRMAERFWNTRHPLFIGETALVELFKWKEKIVRLSKLSDNEIIQYYHLLLKRLITFKEDLIEPRYWAEAYRLCAPVDEADTPHLALTLQLDGLLWTGDQRLIAGLRGQGFQRFFDWRVAV